MPKVGPATSLSRVRNRRMSGGVEGGGGGGGGTSPHLRVQHLRRLITTACSSAFECHARWPWVSQVVRDPYISERAPMTLSPFRCVRFDTRSRGRSLAVRRDVAEWRSIETRCAHDRLVNVPLMCPRLVCPCLINHVRIRRYRCTLCPDVERFWCMPASFCLISAEYGPKKNRCERSLANLAECGPNIKSCPDRTAFSPMLSKIGKHRASIGQAPVMVCPSPATNSGSFALTRSVITSPLGPPPRGCISTEGSIMGPSQHQMLGVSSWGMLWIIYGRSGLGSCAETCRCELSYARISGLY